MAAPTVSSTNPATGSTNVGLNQTIAVVFDTALDSTTVIPANFLLTHNSSGMKISVTVALDTTTNTVTVTPTKLLFKNSTYKLRIVGADLSAVTGSVESSTDDALAETVDITFTTGEELDIPADEKSIEEKANEGQLYLPGGVIVGPSARFQLVSTKPKDNSWGFTGDRITLTFNRNVENTTITGNIVVNQLPFLDEEGWIARENTGSTADPYIFGWNSGEHSVSSDFFDLPTWDMEVSGKTVNLKITESSGNIFRNVRYEIDIYEDLTDTTGNNLIREELVTFTSVSYPNYVTPRTIRNEVNAIFDTLNLDFVHELVWKYSVDAFRIAGWSKKQFSSKGRELRNYVKCSASLAIMRDLMLNKTIMAGVSKTLGDMTITYHPNAGNMDISKNPVLAHYTKCRDMAERAIAYRRHAARPFIRGWSSSLEPLNFRNRLWKNPGVANNFDGTVQASPHPLANTRSQRASKLPGTNDLWS